MWRACWDIIPHGVNLCSKGISSYVGSKRCGKDEHLMHLLFECPWVNSFWHLSGCDVGDRAFSSFWEALDWVWTQLAKDKAELFLVLCWQVWKAGNELVFDNAQAPPRLYISRAKDWLHEYQQAQSLRCSKSWCCPPYEVFKVNCDGAFDASRDKFGIGFLVQNWAGEFVVGGAKTMWVGGSVGYLPCRCPKVKAGAELLGPHLLPDYCSYV